MNKPIMCAMLAAALTARIGAAQARAAGESGHANELPAGVGLPDGTVAGELQALDFFKTNEPALYKRLHDMEPGTMRRLYGKYFMWFQRVGNYRKRQKNEMVRQLKSDLEIRDLSEGLRKSPDSADKAAIRARMLRAVEDLFESDLSLLEIELRNAEEALSGLQGQVEKLAARVAERRKSRLEVIASRMKELTGQD